MLMTDELKYGTGGELLYGSGGELVYACYPCTHCSSGATPYQFTVVWSGYTLQTARFDCPGVPGWWIENVAMTLDSPFTVTQDPDYLPEYGNCLWVNLDVGSISFDHSYGSYSGTLSAILIKTGATTFSLRIFHQQVDSPYWLVEGFSDTSFASASNRCDETETYTATNENAAADCDADSFYVAYGGTATVEPV